MDRRKFVKGVGIGAGVIAGGLILPSLAAEQWGPDGPEVDDPREPSFWEEDAGPFPDSGPLNSDLQMDMAVVGSGISGLSAAWTLKSLRPELKLCVLDSCRPCSGASSRNSAHLLPTYNNWEGILSSQGAETVRDLNRFSLRGVEAVMAFCRDHQIDCGLHREPLVWAATKKQTKALEDLYAKMKLAGLEGRFYSGKEFEARAGTGFYQSGVEVLDNYIAHPGKLMKGLAQKALESGIPVFGHSPVLEVESSDSGTEAIILKTPKASVACNKVLFATNAYSPRLRGLLSSRVIPIVLGSIATEPMSEQQRSRAGFIWNHLTEIQLLSRTIGLTPDNRTYLRGIFGYSSFNSCLWKNPGRDFERLERELRQRAPWAEGLKVTHRWTGAVAMTYSSRPIAGPLPAKGQYVCAGYNGHGMVHGFYHGRLVAHQMIGADHPDLKYLPRPSGWIPPEPSRSIGAKTFFFFKL